MQNPREKEKKKSKKNEDKRFEKCVCNCFCLNRPAIALVYIAIVNGIQFKFSLLLGTVLFRWENFIFICSIRKETNDEHKKDQDIEIAHYFYHPQAVM